MTPIGYTADADTWCPECAEIKYRCAALGFCPKCGAHIYPAKQMSCPACNGPFTQKDLEDGEGNEVGAIFSWDGEGGMTCSGCGKENP